MTYLFNVSYLASVFMFSIDSLMWANRFTVFLLFIISFKGYVTDESDETVLYYYGLEESERGVAACGAGAACAALLRRYWRGAALLRLCRCARRRACHAPAPPHRRLPINNRAHLQFCESVTDWPECSIDDVPLTVETSYDRMNPDELEEMHHKGIQLTPPKITLTCRCQHPNYWKQVNASEHGVKRYKCSTLPPCKSGDFCGNVNYDLNALYQSCMCPRNHICVHNGGITHIQISELLYSGLGWRAYCQPLSDDYSYEDY